MALKLIFGAMTHHRHWSSGGQLVQQAKRELLAVILDRLIPLVDRSAFEQLVAIPFAEPRPSDFPGLNTAQQLFARTEIRHPDVIKSVRKATSSKAAHQDPEPVTLPVDRRPN